MEFIPLIKPFMGLEEEQEVTDSIHSGLIGTGPKTDRFEKEFAGYIGRKYAIGTDSCTNAMHMALVAFGIGPGDEVITTPLTFVSTVNSIVYTGATPVLVDIEPDTFNINPELIEKAITKRTRAVMPVHLYGHPCEMEKIIKIAASHNIKVISDCAHAIEAEYQGKKVGSWGDAACFSFYATKNLATGNGGMLATDDARLADLIKIIRDHGMSAGAWSRYYEGEFKHYQMTHLGYKCIMWDLQAALGLQQLRRIEQRHIQRLQLAEMYRDLLQPLAEFIEPLHPRKEVKHAYHLFPVMLKNLSRDRVAVRMEGDGIGVGVHFRPVHLEPYYREHFRYQPGAFPIAEMAGSKVLSLPFWPEMSKGTAHRVVRTLGKVVKELSMEKNPS